MKCFNQHRAVRRNHSLGMSLVELLTAVGVGTLTLSTLMGLYLFGLRSFGAMGNYAHMDSESRLSMDQMLREMREASQVVGSQNSGNSRWISLVCTNVSPIITNTFTWDVTARTLRWDKTGSPSKIVLTGCNDWSYQFYLRTPGSNYVFVPTSNMALCKLIQMDWSCVRTNTLSPINTANMVTAEVVLRNKHY